MLAVNYLNKSFGGLQANQNINFEVAEGEILGVIGPNGAGKSTLFDLVTGFEKPDSGDVLFLGKSILGLRPDQINRLGIGRTFQKLKPFPQMTVEENVMVGLMQHVSQMNEAREEAHRYLEFVGLIDKRSVYAHGLSTGQRKRLELARAMASRPKLLLLDEVTGGVDQKTVPELVSLVERGADRAQHEGSDVPGRPCCRAAPRAADRIWQTGGNSGPQASHRVLPWRFLCLAFGTWKYHTGTIR